jgi:tRNA threonylcarbamoyladenosine biosynthesis protein TsaB
MRLLAIDSATASASAALWLSGQIAASEFEAMTRGHAEAFAPMVARVLRVGGVDARELDRIAVTVGPGHFTGLRVGLALARGLALATGRRLVGATTLAAIAHGVPAEQRAGSRLLVAIHSKRAEPYLQAFDEALDALTPPLAMAPSSFAARQEPGAPFVVAGDESAMLVTALRASGHRAVAARAPASPDARHVAALAALGLADLPPSPIYVHPAEVTRAAS